MCRGHLMQLHEQMDKFHERDVRVFAVAPAKPEMISSFLQAFTGLPFPLYGDPDKEAFYGLGHVTMPKGKLLAKAAWAGVTGQVKNIMPKDQKQRDVVMTSMKQSDVYIQGGTWLFNEDGELLFEHRDASPEDHLSAERLLQLTDYYLAEKPQS
ncbi:peroxiredoxin-like family protein [Salisediminibacterium halotolerans]|nr:peroxiredoxin-like family protein [Salisediminibacterium haloalkalitolerans]